MKYPSLFLVPIFLLIVGSDLAAKSKFTIAYIPGKRSSFYESVEKGIRKKAREYNAQVIVPAYPESWDADEQIKIIQSVFTIDTPQILVISPASDGKMGQTLLDLHNQGIKIVTINREINTKNLNLQQKQRFPLLHITTDQWKGGKAMADRMAELIDSKGTVYINSTFPDIPSISRRFKAFLQALESFPNISIVGIDIAGIDFSNSDKGLGGSSKELERNAFKQSLEIVQKHPDINAIFCTNDLSGKGIIQTMLVTGLEGSVKIGVWDTTPEMVTAIDNGIVDLALAQKPEEMGSAAVFWGYRFLESQEGIPDRIVIDFEMVTKANSSEKKMRDLVYD
ncbi:MAG: substrate-binding domain-containing protein [Proteobacteria bacterium]|nr:substrate-binding domain-containing protein [Pseudomonadota bacterium]